MQISSFSEVLQSTSVSDLLFVTLVLGVPGILLVLVFLQHILGYFLAQKYDKVFFKSPYFTTGEIGVYSSWPFSLIRFATYIIHAAFPAILHKRRFKGQESPYKPSKLIKISCQLWLVVLMACIIVTPILIVFLFLV